MRQSLKQESEHTVLLCASIIDHFVPIYSLEENEKEQEKGHQEEELQEDQESQKTIEEIAWQKMEETSEIC